MLQPGWRPGSSALSAGLGHRLSGVLVLPISRDEGELVLAFLMADLDDLARVELVAQDRLAEGVLDVVLDRPAERPGAEVGVVALLDEVILGAGVQLQG